MKINNKNWKQIKVKDLFYIKSGIYIPWEEKQITGTTKTIASGTENNGWSQNLNITAIFKKGSITVARNGSVGKAFYQNENYFATDDVRVWEAKKGALTENEGLFFCTLIELERKKYSYGRKWSIKNMENTILYIPVTAKNEVDWEYIDKFMKNIRLSTKNSLVTSIKHLTLNINFNTWKTFLIKNIFQNISIAKSEDIGSLETGKFKFIGRSFTNNGFQGYVNSNVITKGNCITISMVGTFVAFYQQEEFVASQNMLILRTKQLNKYLALFLCTVLNKEIKAKYSYNRPIQKCKFINQKIKLPADSFGNPNWEFMENYMKLLPFSDKI